MTTTTLDPEKQKQAKQYARINRRLWLVDTLATAIYLLAWLMFGWANALAAWLRTFTTNEWLLVLAFTVVFGGIASLLELPLGYYSGFVLPHRFGQSTQDFNNPGTGLPGPAADRRVVVVVDRRRHAGLYRHPVQPGARPDHAALQQICPAGRGARRTGRTPDEAG
jgi:hypothetical protein